MLQEVMTVPELAAYLRVHDSTIYRLLKRNALPGFRVGSDWRFLKSSIDGWLVDQSSRQGIGG
ncbi:MAG: helix-turn-helix domain-containing protein [Candidatus Binatus sp.]